MWIFAAELNFIFMEVNIWGNIELSLLVIVFQRKKYISHLMWPVNSQSINIIEVFLWCTSGKIHCIMSIFLRISQAWKSLLLEEWDLFPKAVIKDLYYSTIAHCTTYITVRNYHYYEDILHVLTCLRSNLRTAPGQLMLLLYLMII